MELSKPVTVSTKSKEEKIKERMVDIEIVEEFMQTPYYHEFFGRLLDALIEKYTNFALNAEDPKEFEVKYSSNMIYIRLRKELLAIKNNPAKRLKEMKINLDTILKNN